MLEFGREGEKVVAASENRRSKRTKKRKVASTPQSSPGGPLFSFYGKKGCLFLMA